jgi:hypothetical protein
LNSFETLRKSANGFTPPASACWCEHARHKSTNFANTIFVADRRRLEGPKSFAKSTVGANFVPRRGAPL